MGRDDCEGEPFSLRVVGDSMMPEFKDGNIIVIDPNEVVRDGSLVLAVLNAEHIFRQWRVSNGRYYLKPLNDTYPTVEVAGPQVVCGVVVEGGSTRPNERKQYRDFALQE